MKVQKIFASLLILILTKSAFSIELDTKNEYLWKGKGRTLGYKQYINDNHEKFMDFVDTAKMFLGIKYKFGGESLYGLDCSYLIQRIFNMYGIRIPRTTWQIWNDRKGIFVNAQNLSPGDILFFKNTYRRGVSHVGIYIGNNRMIHASSWKGKVVVTDLTTNKYLRKRYHGAKRFLT
jgi:cell wall-associated NlpC family hydrolase